MTPTTSKALLRAAREHMQRVGHHKGQFYADNGQHWREAPCCPVGACYIAAGFDPFGADGVPFFADVLVNDAVKVAHDVLRDDYGEDRCLTTWADADERTQDQVLALLETAEREAP